LSLVNDAVTTDNEVKTIVGVPPITVRDPPPMKSMTKPIANGTPIIAGIASTAVSVASTISNDAPTPGNDSLMLSNDSLTIVLLMTTLVRTPMSLDNEASTTEFEMPHRQRIHLNRSVFQSEEWGGS